MQVLSFKGKATVETYHHTVPHHIFEFHKELSVLEKGEEPNLEGNLIIEGNNLLALKALLPTHAGRIKCVYIDPPYNTGNENWVYNDNLTQPQFKEWIGKVVGKEGEDACRHDKWCCMMYPRLQLLKELLRDEGAIFISIDDKEVHHLRMVMDEIFYPENFITQIVWQKKYTQSNDADFFSITHDHILVYAKLRNKWEPNLSVRSKEADARFSNPDNDLRGKWKSIPLHAKSGNNQKGYTFNNGYQWNPPEGTFRRYSDATLKGFDENKEIWWGVDGKAEPSRKRFLKDVQQGMIPKTIWLHHEAGHNDEAKTELKKILGANFFSSPKPVRLLKKILSIATDSGDIVLDSFAGSGTLAHAILELNREASETNRKFVLIQQPYDTKNDETTKFNICRRVTAERISRVIAGYKFHGTKRQILLEEPVSVRLLKKANQLFDRIEIVKAENQEKFDEIKIEIKNCKVQLIGIKQIKVKTEGIKGSFTYARLSPKPILGEYHNFQNELPAYDEIAKYVFYTHTSRHLLLTAMEKKTGFIGQHAGRSYYLLYKPNSKTDWALDMDFLKKVAAQDANKELFVYCEKIWVHRSDLHEWEMTHGRRIHPMLVPFNLK